MNIYVGNLHFNVNEEELKEIFEEFGEIMSVRIITDKQTGRSKGFGFVEMIKEEDASAAIENLDGTEIRGRRVKVNRARERS